MSGFWRNWLTAWCFAIALFGITLVGGSFEATSGPTRILFSLLNRSVELHFTPHLRFSLAVMGGVTIGWSLTLLAAIRAAHQLDEKQLGKPIWVLVTTSVLGWWVIDSILSIATGFWLNTIPNAIYTLAFLLPVIRSGVLSNPENSGT